MSVVLGQVLVDGALQVAHTRKAAAPDPFLAKRKLANFATRTLNVRGGKGGKDGVGFFGAEAAQMLRVWLGIRREAMPEDYLFVDRMGRSFTGNHAVRILHRLSNRAGLARKVGPRALRHSAATSILNQTGDLELVRQVLRHESLVSRTPVGSTRPITRLNANNTLQRRRR